MNETTETYEANVIYMNEDGDVIDKELFIDLYLSDE